MKPVFILFFTVLIICNTNAQTYPWLGQFYNEIPTKEQLWDSSITANHYSVMTRTFSQFNKKGSKKKRTDIFLFTYDEKGFLASYYETNSKNKKSEKHEYNFKDSALVSYNYFKNNKPVRQYEITRNAKKKISDLVKKNSKGEIVSKQHTDFDPVTNYITRVAIYDKKGKEKKAIEYTYYEGKTMKQAKEYRKGKLKKIWNYTCDSKGIDEKKVKEIKVCKNVNVDENGNRVESNRIVNPKGEVELRVNTFDRNERMIKQVVYDDIKHKLKSEYSVNFKNGIEEVVHKSYNKKRKPAFITTTTFNSSHKILSYEYLSGKKLKPVYRSVFTYNDKNLITHSEGFDRKNRKTTENIHTYN
jgi:hypothetical protein